MDTKQLDIVYDSIGNCFTKYREQKKETSSPIAGAFTGHKGHLWIDWLKISPPSRLQKGEFINLASSPQVFYWLNLPCQEADSPQVQVTYLFLSGCSEVRSYALQWIILSKIKCVRTINPNMAWLWGLNDTQTLGFILDSI